MLRWLTDAERQSLAAEAHKRAQLLDDPRYWGHVFPPPPAEFSPEAREARLAAQLRWAHLAAVLDPAGYSDAPERLYRRAHPS